MKKILLAISMMLSLMACVNEVITLPSETVDTDGEVVLNLSAVVPEAQIATKGTFATPTITSLNVLMFDDKGFMVANAVALNEDESEWTAKNVTDDIVKFKVTLPKTGNSCTLHFVANADVSTVEYGMETDVITSLATAGTKDAYWQKVNLPRLIDEGDLTAKCPVQLIRNHAKVTLVSSVKTFKPTGYALINYPTSGTVAPYNTTNGAFQVYNDGNVGKDYHDLVGDKYSAFMPDEVEFSGFPTSADNISFTALTSTGVDSNSDNKVDEFTIEGAPLYTYESTYGKTFLLVQGIFDENKDGNFTESESYYKIDFYDPSLDKNCDILRNINYQFTITNVIGAGYQSVVEAADPNVAAGNNISNSLLTKNLINISDGTQRLSVEYTTKYLTSSATFTLKYMFEPNIKATTTATINKVSANGVPTETSPIVITSEVWDDYLSKDIRWTVSDENNTSGYSIINITPQDFPAEGQIFKKRITIKSTYDGTTMNRVVDLFFINPYSMDVACDPKRVAAATGQPITVNTVIPGDLPSALFPLVFEIEAEAMSLYPNTSKSAVSNDSKIMPVVSGKSIIPGKTKNTFHYERTLTLAEYEDLGGMPDMTNDNPVIVPSYFLTNKVENASAVYVSNSYFDQDKDFFVNQSSLIDEGFYGAGNTVQLICTTSGTKTFTATGAHFSNGTNTMSGTATTETPFVQTLTTINWNTVVKVNDGASDIPGKARTKLRMTATSISLNTEPLAGNRALGIYETVDAAKSMKNPIGETTTSDLKSGNAILIRSGLAETTDLYFSYTDGSYVYVASAKANALHVGAALTFAQYELPLEMSATLEGEQYYGAGKTVTLNLTTNKAGTYTVTFKEGDATTSKTITVEDGQTTGTATYTTTTFNGAISATVAYTDNSGSTDTIEVEGDTRNKLVLGKMTASSNAPADNKDVEIRNASNNSTYTTVKWSELKAGGVEVTISGLANMNSNAIRFRYTSDPTKTNWFGTTYTTTPLIASDAMSGKTLDFN